jgi:Helicase conserved C-terminal domain/SNF2-related domain
MPIKRDIYDPPTDLVLGTRLNARVPEADQKRQRAEVEDILRRLRNQPGVILADEVGMGKTFVALAIAYTVAVNSPRGPVIIMVPANLVDKWAQDLRTFCELYLEGATRGEQVAGGKDLRRESAVRCGVARHSIDLMKLLDDPPRERCHLIFLAQGAMSRRQGDKWIRLALIAEALRRHGRGKASRLIQVKKQIHRFLAELLWAIGEERAHDWGEDLWQQLLRTDPTTWKNTYNSAIRDERRRLTDDPVPKSVIRALQSIELKPLSEALLKMPVRTGEGVSDRLDNVRKALRKIEEELWKNLLAQVRWRSPLLVMDEAHHLKNPKTSLARQLQSPDSEQDLRTGDGAMAKAFDRMLFLTATPFQLGHHELVSVLKRFGDVRWDEKELGTTESFHQRLADLGKHLTESQRAGIALQRSWSRLRPEDVNGDGDVAMWWEKLLGSPRDDLSNHQRAVVDAYENSKRCRAAAGDALRPWIVRHNKGTLWVDTNIVRRQRLDGAAMDGQDVPGGIPIPQKQLLPFFLGARSAVSPGKDLLGAALCSSYEAFRFTRRTRKAGRDEQDDLSETDGDLSHSGWYLVEFDRALESCSGASHPKMYATVRRVVDLWEAGEKVLVFAFYRQTCRALRVHISQEIERRMMSTAQGQLHAAGREADRQEIDQLLERIQRRYFDDLDSPGRRALDDALGLIIQGSARALNEADSSDERVLLTDVMRRFLRVTTTLIRCFPLAELETLEPSEAVRRTLDRADGSGVSWRNKFNGFVDFLTRQCSTDERRHYLEAAHGTQTGGIRVEADANEDSGADASALTLANVQVATGVTHRSTRARLMRAFNTPFFPDILVCSEVMGEGVDLQRFCRHVIHHDLAWNPSSIEQRTGRIDRIGCKAEGRQPIVVYLPYLAGTSDERQYKVMSDRERWFRVVMGQDEVAQLITPESSSTVPLPDAIANELSFDLGLGPRLTRRAVAQKAGSS